MKESYIEGVATHDDPESCVGVREDEGEALTGARAGWVLSREIRHFRVLTPLTQAEGNTVMGAIASPWSTLRGRRPHARTETSCTGTGRSTDRPWQVEPWAASERPAAVRR
jgi:RNA-directed DNA polymerase